MIHCFHDLTVRPAGKEAESYRFHDQALVRQTAEGWKVVKLTRTPVATR